MITALVSQQTERADLICTERAALKQDKLSALLPSTFVCFVTFIGVALILHIVSETTEPNPAARHGVAEPNSHLLSRTGESLLMSALVGRMQMQTDVLCH